MPWSRPIFTVDWEEELGGGRLVTPGRRAVIRSLLDATPPSCGFEERNCTSLVQFYWREQLSDGMEVWLAGVLEVRCLIRHLLYAPTVKCTIAHTGERYQFHHRKGPVQESLLQPGRIEINKRYSKYTLSICISSWICGKAGSA